MSSALKSTATGDTSRKPQRIHTPACILDPLYEFWPEGIALDPCGSPDGLVKADCILCPENGEDGLAVDWCDRTFVNPPYRELKKWLAHGVAQPGEQVWLIPNRSNRPWLREFVAKCDVVIELDSIAFDGYAAKFPAPLLLCYMTGPTQSREHYMDKSRGFLATTYHLGGLRVGGGAFG